MVKKFSVLFVILAMLFCTVNVFAGTDDDAIKAGTVELYRLMDDEGGSMEMRGFAASPDGEYLYCGFLQGYRHVSKINAATGEWVADYEPWIENDDGVNGDNNYPKGFAVDNRGYLFVGITHADTGYISLAVVDSDMEEITYITEFLDTDKTGINGVATQMIDDRIYCYVTTCYNKDQIRCYDVTDIYDIKLNEDFGNKGVIDYNELLGSQQDPGYLTVDTEGYVYLCYKKEGSSGNKGSTVVKLSEDGKEVLAMEDHMGAYGICNAGDYLFVTTYEKASSCVYALNKEDLSLVHTFVYEDQQNHLSGIYYAGGYLYIGDQGDGSSLPGMILRAEFDLTRAAEETATAESQPPKETEPPETEETAAATDPAATDEQTENDQTQAGTADSEGESTANKPADPKDTDDSKDDDEAKSSPVWLWVVIALAGVIVIGFVVLVIVKRKK